MRKGGEKRRRGGKKCEAIVRRHDDVSPVFNFLPRAVVNFLLEDQRTSVIGGEELFRNLATVAVHDSLAFEGAVFNVVKRLQSLTGALEEVPSNALFDRSVDDDLGSY